MNKLTKERTILQPYIQEIKVRKAINKNGRNRKENVIKSNLLILIEHYQHNFNQNLKGNAFIVVYLDIA